MDSHRDDRFVRSSVVKTDLFTENRGFLKVITDE